jgi:hypothetical protein
MIARQLGAVARYESEHKSARLRGKMEQKAGAGEWLGGPVPFGWRRTERGRLELEPAEAELIASGTLTLLDGGNLRAIVRAWETSGVKARHGKRTNDVWHRRTVSGILARWRNAGMHEHLGEAGSTAEWPPIPGVSVADVRAVRALLAERRDAYGVGNRARHLLSGVATCGECGAPVMAGSAAKGRASAHVYRCTTPGRGHVNRGSAPIDDLVLRVVAGRLALPDVADLVAAPATDELDVPALRTEAERLRGRLDMFAEMLAEGEIDRAGYRTATAKVRAKVDEAEAAVASAARRSPLAPMLTAPDPAAAFVAADVEVQRAVIRELCTVRLNRPGPGRKPFDPESVKIEWKTGDQ